MPRASDEYERSVFINCPFDTAYVPLFEAAIFAVCACGLRPRCALEVADSGEGRVERILTLIGQCRYGIHDISRTDSDPHNHLPRFNMPLELGMFLGARRLGTAKQKRKVALVLDREPYRYQQYLSDIAGQDISPHADEPRKLIRVVRDWLQVQDVTDALPGGSDLWDQYGLFREARPNLLDQFRLREERMTFDELTFADRLLRVREWLDDDTAWAED